MRTLYNIQLTMNYLAPKGAAPDPMIKRKPEEHRLAHKKGKTDRLPLVRSNVTVYQPLLACVLARMYKHRLFGVP